jgi:hypothetical protein
MSNVTKPIMLNETGEQIVQKLSEMTESNKSYEMLLNTKADKVDVSAPFNFKGDTTYASLPTSGNKINDTYYCSDKKCRYTWNGEGWYQSSMNEVDYTDELAKMGSDLEAGMSQLSSEIDVLAYENNTINEIEYENGTLATDGSLFLGNTTRIINRAFIADFDYSHVKIFCKTGYKYSYTLYDNNGAVLSISGWQTEPKIFENKNKFRVTIAKINDTDITPSEKTNVCVYLFNSVPKISKKIDEIMEKLMPETSRVYSSKDIELGTVSDQGLNSNYNWRLRTKDYISVLPNTKYTLTFLPQSTINASISFYSKNDFATPRIGYTQSYGTSGMEFVTPDGCNYIRILFKRTDESNEKVMDVTEVVSFMLYGNYESNTKDSMVLSYSMPVLMDKVIGNRQARKTNQDICVYNGNVIEFDVGKMVINGKEVSITNGHGNNCGFGKTLHGAYPYLYCGAWNENEMNIYVNQITDTSATLVRTINFPTLSGYLNMAVDEENERFYIFLADDAYVGNITFIVADFEGNIITTKPLAKKIPIIQGIEFFDGYIYLLNGSPNTGDKQRLTIFDVEGNIVSQTSKITPTNEIEGISFDVDGTLYIANIEYIYH